MLAPGVAHQHGTPAGEDGVLVAASETPMDEGMTFALIDAGGGEQVLCRDAAHRDALSPCGPATKPAREPMFGQVMSWW